MMNWKKIVLAACLLLTGCGGGSEPAVSPTTDPGTAPETSAPEPAVQTPEPPELAHVKDVSFSCNNQGEDAQHVVLESSLDSPAEGIQEEDFSVTLAGDVVEAEDLTVEAAGDCITITIHIGALKFGQLNLTYTGTAAEPFTCQGIVTPGLKLAEAVQDPAAGAAAVQVLNAWDVRGAVQIQLWENEALVLTQGENPSETTAVHRHDFLNIDCETAAANIAAALAESYPDGYRFTSQGDTVLLEKLEPEGETSLALAVLEYLTLN